MSTNPIRCAATPAALARHVDYVQRLIEDSYAGVVAILSDLPDEQGSGDVTIAHWRDLNADNGRIYGIRAVVLFPDCGEGRLLLYVDAKGDGRSYGEVTLTTTPDTDSALISALNVIAEINEQQNITN